MCQSQTHLFLEEEFAPDKVACFLFGPENNSLLTEKRNPEKRNREARRGEITVLYA